jgi:ABC-type transporter MlaC component
MKRISMFPLLLALFCFSAAPLIAQDQPAQTAQQPSTEELDKQKAEREKNAYRLLDQIVDEAQSLRLTENRVRIQITAADMLWDQNQGRARSLFASAAEGIAEVGRTQSTNNNRRQVMPDGTSFQVFQGGGPQNMRTYQLRQELVLTAARHDAALAYQMLAATKPPANTQPTADARGPRPQLNSDESLEQTLLGRIAALDPKLAAQNAEQMMDKGQFPMTMPEVINQLYKQDADAAEKLGDKTVKKIQAANILARTETGGLVQALLRAGPRPASDEKNSTAQATVPGWTPVLGQSAYVDLLSTVVDAALKATPNTQNNQRGGGPVSVRRAGPGANPPAPQPLTDAQIEQTNARRLLAGLQQTLPMLDQYLPSKAPLVRQKMSELGLSNVSPMNLVSALQGNATADALVQAAAAAPQQLQPRLYTQAAYKALEEGDTERARQIANDHLQNNARDTVMQRIDFREMAKKAEGARIDEIRQAVARLQTDNEKIDLLIQVAGDMQKTNQKLAIQLLDEAKQIVSRRATSYEQFEQQLRVAHAFASVDPARSFEVLDPGISQLNELLQAASVLSGFEINMFRDGEMAMQGGNGLTAIVNRYGQEIAVLAKTDFERSEALAGRFQFTEPRIMTKLAMVQGLLNVKPLSGARPMVGNFGESIVIRP